MAGNLPPGCTQQMCDEAQPGYWDDEYDDDPREDDCDHEEYEVDWEGRAMCHRCGHGWWASEAQIAADLEHQREWAQWQEYQESRWYRFRTWLAHRRVACLQQWQRLWKRKPKGELDDEIPF